MEPISDPRLARGSTVGSGPGGSAVATASPASLEAGPFPSLKVLLSRFGTWRRAIGTLGPGMLIAVGYVDPGNWATDIGGGAQYGYELLSIVLLANVMAMAAQAFCVRLAIATGKGLAELCREEFSPPIVVLLWLLAEAAMVATDLAELIGSAIALKLLLGIALLPGVLVVSAITFVLLLLGGEDGRLRGLVCMLMAVVAASFVVLLLLARPDWLDVAKGFLPPSGLVADRSMLVLAVGIVGATVMPHNLYLHSGLLAPVGRPLDGVAKQRAIKHNVRDSNNSLGMAFFINAAILVAAGAVFHAHGLTEINDLGAAYRLLDPVLGTSVAATLFAVALLAAGQSSTITATLAGQVMMHGFVRVRLSPVVRRLVIRLAALGPALLYLGVVGDSDTSHLLILSQVVLSMQLPFALIPLVRFVGRSSLMGEFALGRAAALASWGIALVILLLNIVLILQMLG